MKEMTVKEVAREIERRARAPHWPTGDEPIIKTEIELFIIDTDPLCSQQQYGYRVRKVEHFPEHRFKKYGLSWKTGEWMLVPDGGRYADETFLEVPRREAH